MLRWAVIFAVLALVAALLGFGGLASGFAAIAKFLFFLFVIVFVIVLVLGIATGRKLTGGGMDRTLP
jgi:uncharacterized membrane protein YtjA (UPF0391 family)